MARGQAIRAEPGVARIPLEQIGGGRVVRPFYVGGTQVKVGAELTAEFIRSINPSNRASLLGRFIAVWPKAPGVGVASRLPDAEGQQAERHVVALGFGRYNVIEGVILNESPMNRASAYELAGKPEPEAK